MPLVEHALGVISRSTRSLLALLKPCHMADEFREIRTGVAYPRTGKVVAIRARQAVETVAVDGNLIVEQRVEPSIELKPHHSRSRVIRGRTYCDRVNLHHSASGRADDTKCVITQVRGGRRIGRPVERQNHLRGCLFLYIRRRGRERANSQFARVG